MKTKWGELSDSSALRVALWFVMPFPHRSHLEGLRAWSLPLLCVEQTFQRVEGRTAYLIVVDLMQQ